jgi:hypothetical protein
VKSVTSLKDVAVGLLEAFVVSFLLILPVVAVWGFWVGMLVLLGWYVVAGIVALVQWVWERR